MWLLFYSVILTVIFSMTTCTNPTIIESDETVKVNRTREPRHSKDERLYLRHQPNKPEKILQNRQGVGGGFYITSNNAAEYDENLVKQFLTRFGSVVTRIDNSGQTPIATLNIPLPPNVINKPQTQFIQQTQNHHQFVDPKYPSQPYHFHYLNEPNRIKSVQTQQQQHSFNKVNPYQPKLVYQQQSQQNINSFKTNHHQSLPNNFNAKRHASFPTENVASTYHVVHINHNQIPAKFRASQPIPLVGNSDLPNSSLYHTAPDSTGSFNQYSTFQSPHYVTKKPLTDSYKTYLTNFNNYHNPIGSSYDNDDEDWSPTHTLPPPIKTVKQVQPILNVENEQYQSQQYFNPVTQKNFLSQYLEPEHKHGIDNLLNRYIYNVTATSGSDNTDGLQDDSDLDANDEVEETEVEYVFPKQDAAKVLGNNPQVTLSSNIQFDTSSPSYISDLTNEFYSQDYFKTQKHKRTKLKPIANYKNTAHSNHQSSTTSTTTTTTERPFENSHAGTNNILKPVVEYQNEDTADKFHVSSSLQVIDSNGDTSPSLFITPYNPTNEEAISTTTPKVRLLKHTRNRILRRKSHLVGSLQMNESCERTCLNNIVNQEYDPLCASNNKTYSNIGKFRCTKICGELQLTVSHFGSCKQQQNSSVINTNEP